MTEAQRDHFYFPAFSRCCRANNWRMAKGRLVCDPQSNPLLPELAQVWTYARQIAEADHRGIVVRDLRYACHIVALRTPKDSEKLTNQEVNRVVDLFNLLSDPDSLTFQSRWNDPSIAKRQSLVETIKKMVPYAYATHIANDLAQRSAASEYDWEREMPLGMLENLYNIAKKRNPRRSEPQWVGQASSRAGSSVASPHQFPKLEYVKKSPAPVTVEEPF